MYKFVLNGVDVSGWDVQLLVIVGLIDLDSQVPLSVLGVVVPDPAFNSLLVNEPLSSFLCFPKSRSLRSTCMRDLLREGPDGEGERKAVVGAGSSDVELAKLFLSGT